MKTLGLRILMSCGNMFFNFFLRIRKDIGEFCFTFRILNMESTCTKISNYQKNLRVHLRTLFLLTTFENAESKTKFANIFVNSPKNKKPYFHSLSGS